MSTTTTTTTTTTAVPTTTRSIREVVVALQHVADLFSSVNTGDDLAFPVKVQVTLSAGYISGNNNLKRAMVDQVARLFGASADYTSPGDHAPYAAEVTVDGQPWELRASAYVRRPDPNAALHAELAELRAKVAAFEAAADEQVTYTLGSGYSGAVPDAERETYEQAELDQDRNPTAEGFAAWQARRAEAHRALQNGQR